MGGVLTTCKQRTSSIVTDYNSVESEDLTRRGYEPVRNIRHDQYIELHSAFDTTIYRHQKSKQAKIKTRTLHSVSSKVTITTENRSESQIYFTQTQFRKEFDFEQFGSKEFRTKDPFSKREQSYPYDEEEPETDYNFDKEHGNVIPFNNQKEDPEPDYDSDDENGNVITFKHQVEVKGHQPLELSHLKTKMEEDFIPEKGRKEKEFQVIKDTKFLPRYTYHRSLLDWLTEGLPQDPVFEACHFAECTILIGGNIKDKTISEICGETTLREKITVKDLQKEAAKYTNFLIVYFFQSDNANVYQEIEQLVRQLSFEGVILFVTTLDIFDNEEMKSTLKKNILDLGISNVEFACENRSEIITKLTCVLEQRLVLYLEGTKMKLRDHSRIYNVRSSLREVNAVLRRLKQAACHPDPLTDDEEEVEDPQEKEIDAILNSFGDKIIYKKYDGNTMYVVTTDQDVKEKLDKWYSKSGIKNLNFKTTVDAKLSISELARTGVPLHGAKFVYVNEDVVAFKQDGLFSTTGSLMMANGDTMLIVTCRHSLMNNGPVYTEIDNAVVRLGQGIPQPQNNMQRLNEDIAVVQIAEETRPVINQKCERLLLDKEEHPVPARICFRELRKDDLVHKRGARTGLTTGIVNSVQNEPVGNFLLPSRAIYIEGRNSKPFADKGDSGSLVFQHSLSAEDNIIDVLAMVQSKTITDCPNPDIICFPFHEGRDSLLRNIAHLEYLQFCNV